MKTIFAAAVLTTAASLASPAVMAADTGAAFKPAEPIHLAQYSDRNRVDQRRDPNHDYSDDRKDHANHDYSDDKADHRAARADHDYSDDKADHREQRLDGKHDYSDDKADHEKYRNERGEKR